MITKVWQVLWVVLVVLFVFTGSAMASDIFTAVKEGDAMKVKEMLEDDPYMVDARDEENASPLYFAPTKEIAEFLIEKGADINAQDKQGMTPLHYAIAGLMAEIMLGSADYSFSDIGVNADFRGIIDLLLEKGADITIKNNEGDSVQSLMSDMEIYDSVMSGDKVMETKNLWKFL